MTTVYLSPIGNGVSFLLFTGLPNAGGYLNTYQAGTSTPYATYTSSSGSVQNPTAIPLGADGKINGEVWLAAGQAYKFIVTDVNGIQVGATLDNIYGINDPVLLPSPPTGSEWISYPVAPTFISGTSFSVPGNQTAVFPPYRRVQSSISSGTLVYGTIASSSYNGSITTVVMTMDSASLDSGLTAVWYGILDSQHPSYPVVTGEAPMVTAAGTADALTATLVTTATTLVDGFQIEVKLGFANATPSPTFDLTLGAVDTGPFTICKYNNLALVAGDLPGANAIAIFRWSATFSRWVLINPAFSPIYPFSVAGQGLVFTSSGTLTVPPGFGFKATLTGGGAGGSLSPGAGSNTVIVFNGVTVTAAGAAAGDEPAVATASGGDININGTHGTNSGSAGNAPNEVVTPTGFGYGGRGNYGTYQYSGNSGATAIKFFAAQTTSQVLTFTVGAGGGNGGNGVVIVEF